MAIELPTVDPGWSCRQGSGLLLLIADVEKIAEWASLKLGSKCFSLNRWCAWQTDKMTPSPTLSKKITGTGKLVPRYESLVPKHESLVPETWKLGSKTWKPDSETWKPGSETWKPGSETKKPGSKTWKPGSETRKPGSETWKPGLKLNSNSKWTCFTDHYYDQCVLIYLISEGGH